MADNWNKAGFFSGITEDYSNYHWYKGEKENPYKSDTFHPLAEGVSLFLLGCLRHKKAFR